MISKQPTVVIGGMYDGHRISKVRGSSKRCANGHICGRRIQPGELYVNGDQAPDVAGGFGVDRLCFACAGIDETGHAVEDAK